MFKKDNVRITTNTFIQDSTFSEQLMTYHSIISIRNLTLNFTYILSTTRAKIWPTLRDFFFYQSIHKIKKYISFYTENPALNFQVANSWHMLYLKMFKNVIIKEFWMDISLHRGYIHGSARFWIYVSFFYAFQKSMISIVSNNKRISNRVLLVSTSRRLFTCCPLTYILWPIAWVMVTFHLNFVADWHALFRDFKMESIHNFHIVSVPQTILSGVKFAWNSFHVNFTWFYLHGNFTFKQYLWSVQQNVARNLHKILMKFCTWISLLLPGFDDNFQVYFSCSEKYFIKCNQNMKVIHNVGLNHFVKN